MLSPLTWPMVSFKVLNGYESTFLMLKLVYLGFLGESSLIFVYHDSIRHAFGSSVCNICSIMKFLKIWVVQQSMLVLGSKN